MSQTITVQGTLEADGTLRLDDKPNLPPGPVTVVLSAKREPAKGDWWQHLQDMRKRLEDSGHRFMDEKEMAEHLAWLREGDHVDELLRKKQERAIDSERRDDRPTTRQLEGSSVEGQHSAKE